MNQTPNNPFPLPKKSWLNGWMLALDKAPLTLSLILLFLLPFLTQLEGVDSIYPKKAASQIIVFLILATWVLKVMITGKLTWVKTSAFWPLAALLVWITGTIFLSPYSQASWNALGGFSYLPIWYLMLTLNCYELWKAENLLVTFIISAFGTCLWAVSQAKGWGQGPMLQMVQTQFGGRVIAGLGNPNFLAGYLLIIWPLALALTIRAYSKMAKALWGSLLALSLLALLWTGSKAGWLGWVAGIVTFCFFFLKFKGGWARARNWLLPIFLMLVISLFTLPMSHRLQELKDTGSESIQFRKQVWSGTVQMLRDHPIKGTGFGTFAAAFPSYRPISLMLHQKERSYEVDHAHNWVLEWVAETGIVGIVLLLAFWAMILRQWFQWYKLYQDTAIPPALSAGVFSVFIGVAVENLFDVNSYLPTTAIPLLFLAAFPVALYQRLHHSPDFPIRRWEIDLSKVRVYLLPVFVLVLGFSFQRVAVAFQGQLGDVQLKKALELSQGQKWDEALALYNRVLKLDPPNLMARYFRGSSYVDRGKAGDLEQALMDYEAVGHQSPDYVLLHFKKAQVLNRLNRLQESNAEMKKAVQLDPGLIIQLTDYKKARQLADVRRFKEALVIYRKLVLDYPTCVPALVDYANCLVMVKKISEAVSVYQRVLVLDPTNNEALNNLKAIGATDGH